MLPNCRKLELGSLVGRGRSVGVLISLALGKIDVLGFDRLHRSAVVTRAPAHDLHAPVVDLIAEGLHGKHGEGFLELSADLLNTEQHDGNHGHGGDEGGVIPRRREGVVHAKGQQEHPDCQESSQMPRVEQRNGTGQQPLGTSQVVLKDGNGRVDLILSHEVHGQIVDGKAQILQGTVGTVGGSDDLLGLLRRKLLVQLGTELGLVLLLGTQVALHGPYEGPRAQGDVVEVVGALLGADTVGVVEGVGHPDKVAGVVDVHAPVLSGLVPTLIRGVGSEDEEKSEGGAGHGEDIEGKGKLGEELNDPRVLDAVEVGVTVSDAVVHDHHGGDESDEADLTEEVLVNARAEDGGQVVEEAILRSVLLPIVVRVDRAAVLALLFAIGQVGNILDVAEGVEACNKDTICGKRERCVSAIGSMMADGPVTEIRGRLFWCFFYHETAT